jgi:TIR domain
MAYPVFISHGWHDRWIAKQMARLIAEAGANPFIDIFDIKKGDRIESKIQEGLNAANELVALLTPWSVDRNWVWAEIAAAWALRKRYVGILYGLTMAHIEQNHGGLAVLKPINCMVIDEFDDDLSELKDRLKAGDAQ